MLKGVLLFLAGLLVGANVVYFLMVRQVPPAPQPDVPATPPPAAATTVETAPAAVATAPGDTIVQPGNAAGVAVPTASRIQGEPLAPDTGTVAPPQVLAPSATGITAQPAAAASIDLMVPVAGITSAQLTDTFHDKRGTEREHEALDIMAPRGTAVYAAADGFVRKLFNSQRGGITLYQFDPGQKYCLYYAHLDSYAPGIVEGRQLKRGEVIGYVGSSGNASPDAPHLHFAVFLLGPDKAWSGGTPINPFPLLTGQR